MLAAILTISGTMNGFAQQPEDLRGIPGTWFFLAKLDNPVDTLLIIPSDATTPTKAITLAKNKDGLFMFNTRLTEPCNFVILTPPNDSDIFFYFNVHAEPGEVLSVQGCYDVNKPVYGLSFRGSRYYKDYAEVFMSLNQPPQEEKDEESDSVLIVIDGEMLPKSMNPQLLNHIPRRHTVEGEEKGVLQQSIAEGKLKSDLQPYFLERDQYIDSIRTLIDVNATAKYGKPGRYGAIEITTRPFLSVAMPSPKESEARRLTYLLDKYNGEFLGFGSYSLFRKDGYIYGESSIFDPDLFDTPVEEHFFGLLTRQHGHSRQEIFGLVSSDAHGIYVPLVREVEIELPSSVDESHFNDVVNAIRQAAAQADKSIERTDSLVRMAFIFGGKVKEGKPRRLNAFQETKRNPIVKESRFYFTPNKKAASYWLAEVYYKTTGPRRLVMHLLSVDKIYTSDCPSILEKRFHVEGTVLDENGQPMPDAVVDGNIQEPSDAGGVRTDKNGHFDLWLPYNETPQVRASKVGYLRGFSRPADNTPITIRLTPKTSPKSQPSLIKAVHTTKEGAVKAGDKISGTVSDDIGPLMGVSVCEIDARGHIVKSAVTDINGHFVMKVRNPENRLRFSYVGMITEKRAIDKKEYKIIMEPSMNPSFPHSTDGQSGYRYIPVDGQRRVNNKGLPIPLREGSNVTERISMAEYEGLGIVEDGEGVSNENNPRVLISLTDEEQALVMPVNDLGFDLLRKVGADENILLSPLGMTYALGLINNGAAGETRRQINKVLGCDDKGTDKFNSFCRKMLTEAPRIDRLTQMEITNEFYSHKSNKPKPIFTKVAKDDYNTQFMESDNGDPLNFSLVNTINFKGVWTDKFHKDDTQDEVFKGEDGKEQTVPMMNQTRQFFYTENDLCQTLCLPYSNEAYQMIVLLPKEGKTVQDVAQSLMADSWEKMYDQMKRITVDVKLPRFESSSEVNLTRVISALMPNAFDMKKADFSNLFDWKSYIAMIKQTGRIKVDETGTEASVVTALQGRIMGLDLAPPEVIYFHATHPFLYFIREWSTGAIFFVGQYMGS
jgi:serpin B